MFLISGGDASEGSMMGEITGEELPIGGIDLVEGREAVDDVFPAPVDGGLPPGEEDVGPVVVLGIVSVVCIGELRQPLKRDGLVKVAGSDDIDEFHT